MGCPPPVGAASAPHSSYRPGPLRPLPRPLHSLPLGGPGRPLTLPFSRPDRAQRLLAAWGLAVTAGYLLSQWLGSAGTALFGLSAAGTLVALWVLLMAAPLALTFYGRKPGFHDGVWTGLVALGLAENAAVARAGGGHDHGAHGHGGSSDGASGADGASGGEGGHHAAEGVQQGSGTPDEGAQPGAPDGQDVSGEEQSGDGHAHPDGGHGSEGGSMDSSGRPESSSTGDASVGKHHDSGAGGGGAHHGDVADGAGGGGGHGDAGGGGDAASIITGDVQHLSYYHLWFAIGAVGFLWSAVHAEGAARKALYGAAAALNAAMVAALVAYPPIGDVAGFIAAGVQGLPMLADLPLRRRVHAAERRSTLAET